MPEAIIFDLDGTLVDSAPDMGRALGQVMEAHGHPPLGPEQLRGFIGNGVAELLRRTMAAVGADPAGFGDWHDAYMDRYAQGICIDSRPYPGVVGVLDRLAATGHPLGVCTNKPQALSEALLGALGLAGHFGAVLGGDTALGRKPAPDGLRAVAARLGGKGAVLVGDSRIDAAAALAAPMPFLLFTGGYRDGPVASIPARAAFEDWGTLPALLATVRAAA